MLAEAWLWLTAPCSSEARRLGYLKEQIALRHRARRCATAWAPHLEQSRAFLLEAARSSRRQFSGQSDIGVILGSGLLLDIPFAELAACFERLWLVDMVHLPEVRRQVKAYPQIRLLEWDVTGTLSGLLALGAGDHFWRRFHRAGGCCRPEEIEACFSAQPVLPDLGPIAWVASVNLLSQLPLLPLFWASRLCPEWTEAMALDRQGRFHRQHRQLLARLAPSGCLIADACQETRTPAGELVTHADYRPCLADLGAPQAEWVWQLAPSGEIRGLEIEHLVQAWRWESALKDVGPSLT